MLIGKLVRLRRYEKEDLDRVLGWINDREITRFLSARYPFSRAQEEDWIDRVSKQPPSEGLSLAIELLSDSRHIGSIGLHEVRWEDRHTTLGIVIGEKDCWGKGYGTDAIVTLLRFAFNEMNLHRVTLDVLTDNDRAIASYRKCGFVPEGTLRQAYYQEGRYKDLLTMGVLAEEFRALYDVQRVQEAS
jgi:RimJ/RimL family protein N-acetyltransferase